MKPALRSFSRRDFLRATAAAGVSRSISADEKDGGFIDAHVHVWTADVEAYPLAAGAKAMDIKPSSFTPEQLFAHCRPRGVARIVLIQMSFYQYDNSYMLDVMQKHPGVFSGVAIVDENRPDLTRAVDQLAAQGVRGFRLYADKQKAEAWLDSPAMNRLWQHAGETGLAMCLLANPDALPVLRRLCGRYPGTRVVIDHFARIGMKGPVDQADLDQLLALADFEQTYVKVSAFYALGEKKAPYTDLAPMIRQLRDRYGARRLMWASDCPFQVEDGHTYADSIRLIRDRLDFLNAEDKEWMLCKTAEKVFFS